MIFSSYSLTICLTDLMVGFTTTFDIDYLSYHFPFVVFCFFSDNLNNVIK